MFNLENYETVDQRLEKFWTKYEDGRIDTELVSFANDCYIFKASIYKTFADAVPFATGYAQENVEGSGVNRKAACENSESSAIGRALHNGGISKHSEGKPRPSREEMIKATRDEIAKPKTEYIPVEKEDDPWTIKQVAAPETVADAVNTVKEIMGTKTEVPLCPTCNKEMNWRTGVSQKTKKEWANFSCKRAVGSGICDQTIWYEISPSGSWVPQKNKY